MRTIERGHEHYTDEEIDAIGYAVEAAIKKAGGLSKEGITRTAYVITAFVETEETLGCHNILLMDGEDRRTADAISDAPTDIEKLKLTAEMSYAGAAAIGYRGASEQVAEEIKHEIISMIGMARLVAGTNDEPLTMEQIKEMLA